MIMAAVPMIRADTLSALCHHSSDAPFSIALK
jgi:hypothetical protein